MKIVLEVPVYTTEAALNAAAYGADRLELCSSFAEGGETPGAGQLSYLKKHLDIPVFVMIRPRGGDFVYTDDEIGVMAEEIRVLGGLGADGFVFGALQPDGSIHRDACCRLVKEARGKPCTFHRAFDVCRRPEEALEEIIECGFRRILTSGGKNSVGEGLEAITGWMEQAGERIIIMPGGGMEPELVEPLQKTGRLTEIHASCKTARPSESRYRKPGVHMQTDTPETGTVLTVDSRKINAFRLAAEKRGSANH